MDKDAIFAPDHLRKKGSTFEHDIEECGKILEKPESSRTNEENEHLEKMIINLGIFDRKLCDHCSPKPLIKLLIPQFQLLHLHAGDVIFHYETNADKMYILLKGKIKDFGPKTLDEIEEENKAKKPVKAKRIVTQKQLQEAALRIQSEAKAKGKIIIPMPEDDAKSSSSESNKDSPNNNKNERSWGSVEVSKNDEPNRLAKNLNKIKGILPFLNKDKAKLTATDHLIGLKYRKLIKKKRVTMTGNIIDINKLEKNIDLPLMQEFVQRRNYYFIGNILKVKFNCFMYPGDVFGIMALKENALRRRAVVAVSSSKVVSLHQEIFQKILEGEKKRLELKRRTFAQIFSKFSQGQTILFSHLWTEEIFRLNELLYQEGDETDGFYLIGDGEILLTKKAVGDRDVLVEENWNKLQQRIDKPKKLLISRIASGSFFGEDEFFLKQNREFSATIKSNHAEVYKLSAQAYQEAQERFPILMNYIMKGCVDKYSWQQERVEKLIKHYDVDMGESVRLYKELLVDKRFAQFLAEIPKKPVKKIFKMKVFEKEKPLAPQIEYDKLWCPKPGQPHSRAILHMVNKIDEYFSPKKEDYLEEKVDEIREDYSRKNSSQSPSPIKMERNREFEYSPSKTLYKTPSKFPSSDQKYRSSTGFYKTARSSSVPENKEYILNVFRETKRRETGEDIIMCDTYKESSEKEDKIVEPELDQPTIIGKSYSNHQKEGWKTNDKLYTLLPFEKEKLLSRSITPGPGGFTYRNNTTSGKLKRMIPVPILPEKATSIPSNELTRIHANKADNILPEFDKRARSTGRIEKLCKGSLSSRNLLRGTTDRNTAMTSRRTGNSFVDNAAMQRTSREIHKDINLMMKTSGSDVFKKGSMARQRMFEPYQNIQNFLF